MNVAKEIAEAMAAAGLGVLVESITVGRIPAERNSDGQWGVINQGGDIEGGNVSKWRVRTQLQVMYQHSNPDAVYENDSKLRNALSQIPYSDARFIDVKVRPLQDGGIAESERRIGVWSVETVTFNAQYGPEGE